MIGYAMLGSNDVPAAGHLYDALLGVLGIGWLMECPNVPAYGRSWDKPMLAIGRSYDGEVATVGNGSMLALVMDSRDKDDALHAKVMALGGRCEGPPRMRGPAEHNFYAAYFRDLDGNKLCAFCTAPA